MSETVRALSSEREAAEFEAEEVKRLADEYARWTSAADRRARSLLATQLGGTEEAEDAACKARAALHAAIDALAKHENRQIEGE